MLDTKIPESQAALKRLAATADVLHSELTTGRIRPHGPVLRGPQSHQPDLIYVSISGFGQTGPYSKRPAYDAVLQPMLGFPVMQGEANGQGSPPQALHKQPAVACDLMARV